MNQSRIYRLAFVVGATLLLTACAGSVSKPVSIQALTPEQKSSIRIESISAESASNVAMTQQDFDRITQNVAAQIKVRDTKVMVATGDAKAMKIKIFFTQYDKGNAFARAMLAGLGQIHIDGDVIFSDANGNITGKYQVSKQFAFGGIMGAATTIEDVEAGFEKSVVAIILGEEKS